MPRIARVEAVGYPHHVMQRGNRSQKVFFSDKDKEEYLKILKLQSEIFGIEVWAYCLMDNHVHLIIVPKERESMIQAIGETHRTYTRMINFREKWRGYLWQGRFKSFVLDERYLIEAVRYVELNPVRAKMIRIAENYTYSSAKAHIKKSKDDVLSHFYLEDKIRDWSRFLKEGITERALKEIRASELTGRPLGDKTFIEQLEKILGRVLLKRKPGPKKK